MKPAVACVGLGALLLAVSAAAAPGYREVVDAVVERYQLPGIAVGVIENGKLVFTATPGERVLGSGKPIDQDTLFQIASNSKAMTSSLLARLAQHGKLQFDDPVRKYLANFAMHDPWVSEHMQVADLLTHSSGLPEGGGDLMLWPQPNRFDRADVIAGLRHLEPAYDFRAGYAYDNLLYVVAGEVAAAAGGAPYPALIRREIFQPLGMTRCQVGSWNRAEVGNVARPHVRGGQGFQAVSPGDSMVRPTTMEAAGGIRCSLGDMLIWARNWLVPSDQQLEWLQPALRQAQWAPYTPMPISERQRRWDGTRLHAYAYGWRIADVDGELTISHTGTLSGMYSAMYLLPNRESGFVFLINADAPAARTVLIEALLEQFTKPANRRSVDSLADELADVERERHASRVPDTSGRVAVTGSELEALPGVWRDPWFGEVSICTADGKLRFVSAMSPTMRGTVMRVGQRYLVDWDEDYAEAWLDFPQAADGVLRMAKVDPDADFSWDFEDLDLQRRADCPSGKARIRLAEGTAIWQDQPMNDQCPSDGEGRCMISEHPGD